jgi:hypothetical protein
MTLSLEDDHYSGKEDGMNCQHQGCRCDEANVERGGKRYCSERCAEIQTSGKHQPHCPCGHPDCAAV